MKINKDLMKADGFKDQEIDTVQEYCASAKASGTFSNAAALVMMRPDSQVMWVCRTVAEVLERLRPGVWIDMLKHQTIATPSDESRKVSHSLVCRGGASCSVSDPPSDSAGERVGGEA